MSLVLDHVEVFVHQTRLLCADISIAPGETLTVMGPSGSGKSTLLNFVAGFLEPPFTAKGRVVLNGHDVTHTPPESRKIGILFQDPVLFPHLCVGENLLFGLRSRVGAKRNDIVADALGLIGLDGFARRDPATLSGGQQARVALMRALLARPDAVLLDEPFSKLDAALRGDMRELTAQALADAMLPAILVTHDAADANAFCGDILDLS
jgi:putative thiamine transport system ATP-binding protein